MKNRFYALDCLRFFAALGVILFHLNATPGNWMSKLYLCVDLFFVLSGFVLEPVFPNRRNLQEYLKFILLRYIRLAPMLYSTLIFSLLYQLAIILKNSFAGGAERPNLHLSVASILCSVMFLQIFSSQSILLNYPMWSLSTEWIINLLLVFPLSGYSRKRNSWYIFCFGVLIQVINIINALPEFISQLSRCLTGIILGVIVRGIFESATTPVSKRISTIQIFVSLVSIFGVGHANDEVAPLLSTLSFATLILAVARIEKSRSLRIPKSLAYWAATLSFGIYAWHVPLAGIVERYSPTNVQSDLVLRFFLLSAISCLMGLVVSKYFERPIQVYLTRIVRNKLG